jgi:hypothetical protein
MRVAGATGAGAGKSQFPSPTAFWVNLKGRLKPIGRVQQEEGRSLLLWKLQLGTICKYLSPLKLA